MLKWTAVNRRSDNELIAKRRCRRRTSIATSVQLTPTTSKLIDKSASLKLSDLQMESSTLRRKSMGALVGNVYSTGSTAGSSLLIHTTPTAIKRISLLDNKENFPTVTSYSRSPFGGCGLPLKDLSNGQSPNRTPQHLRKLPEMTLSTGHRNNPSLYACTLPSFDVEYSPCDAKVNSPAINLAETLLSEKQLKRNLQGCDGMPNSKSQELRNQTNNYESIDEESLSSSKVGDTTLDKMIDAIIESAKKDDNRILRRRKRIRLLSDVNENTLPPAKEVDDYSNADIEVENEQVECMLKRQKVVRRKTKCDYSKNSRENSTSSNKLIGLTLPNGIPSPETPTTTTSFYLNSDDLANMETPRGLAFVVDSFPEIHTKDLQGCSTPTPSRANSIKRCLTFSPDSTEEDELIEDNRKSVTSSLTSSGNLSRTVVAAKGSLDLAIFIENDKLNVHVIRCRDLQRSNGCSAINAYVKVALFPLDHDCENSGYQRTAVHRNSNRPYFDHRFIFDLKEEKQLSKRIQLAVWHRDRELKRSEFLGCMSFSVKNATKLAINGSYKLQSQSCLTNPVPPLAANQNQLNPTTSTSSSNIANNINRSQMATASDRRRSSVEEDVISIDSASAAASHLIDANTGQPITLSKKAIHQRDADENLFLRFLELDPPPDAIGAGGGTAATVAASATGSSGDRSGAGALAASSGGTPQQRRMSTYKPSMGRTPFTITKKLTRTSDKGFGFSIVWTHPPRVEKVEPGLSADRSGIVPGDYVIFVDKHNVVTMPEADVLNLIRSQGNFLNMEIFRRSASSNVPPLQAARQTVVPNIPNVNGISKSRVASAASNCTAEEMSPALKQSIALGPRSSTACSNASIETTKRRLNLPQVTFSKESIVPCHGVDDQRRRFVLQLISREQNFVNALQFGMQRFVTPLLERKDLISPNDHRTLFQNIDELIRISEDILEQLMQDDHEPQINFASRVYLSKTTAICAAYKKYCNGIKRADCVLVNKSRQPGSEFVTFITEPQVPRKRPDLTMFIHRPLQHFREILKLMQLLASHCRVDSEEHKNFTSVINELQAAYREITVGGGLMEPLGEGRPLLTLQDLESRMVFTRCKPFILAVQGRQWIFGGDLSRVEGRSVKPYWTLLFSDILLFAKVSRDRVLFITEEPLPIVNIVDSCFNIRKKCMLASEFRITVDPNGRAAESPTAYCAPDLSRTPKKNSRRKSLILRAPSLELKAVWQNLLQRQIFLVNAALGSTPLSSPLDSPDVLNTLVPLSDIGATTTSMASIKLSSMDSINMKNQQHRNINTSQQIEQLIDEKCRILNKTGTPKGSALHLANWMKGQLDKQQEQARLAAAESRHDLDIENDNAPDPIDEEERITYWTREQLEKRTKELNLAKENGNVKASQCGGKRLGVGDEVGISDVDEDIKSPSRSTTSDSQITVRSSPIANVVDKLSVCRHCHKNCKQKLSPSPPLLSNSLKVQHSQASPNRCCQLSSLVKSKNNRGINNNNSINNNSLTNTNKAYISKQNTTTNGASEPGQSGKLYTRIVLPTSIIGASESENTNEVSSKSTSMATAKATGIKSVATSESTSSISTTNTSSKRDSGLVCTASPSTTAKLLNGNCSGSESDRDTASTTNMTIASQTTAMTTVTTSSSNQKQSKSRETRTQAHQKHQHQHHGHHHHAHHPHQPHQAHQHQSNTNQQFIPCNCKCTPEDFSNTTLSPDEVTQETCKLLEDVSKITSASPGFKNQEDLHKNCKCICKKSSPAPSTGKSGAGAQPSTKKVSAITPIDTVDDSANDSDKSEEDWSLMLIGLAQFNPAVKLVNADAFVPTISVVPPTPDSILSKTSTNIWDNTATTTKMTINNIPRQAIIENIPEDSPDESPQDEEPPYRALNTTLRRYGTISSLEKVPSDEINDHGSSDEGEGEEEEEDEDGEEEEIEDDDIEVITREVFTTDGSSENGGQTSLRNWTARAGSYVAEKMSFFEESRAFIDKYLGRWNQDTENDPCDEDQLDECTSGATSGEEVWGTPTSGGDNDDMQMLNSDHTQSSPTKSSSSLTGDDDTELMMDELLMAPPMTASTIRGLLPRRRLEPLFEEETESDEEKTQQEYIDVAKKGETAANGHDLGFSIGNRKHDFANQRTNLPVITTATTILNPILPSPDVNIKSNSICETEIMDTVISSESVITTVTTTNTIMKIAWSENPSTDVVIHGKQIAASMETASKKSTLIEGKTINVITTTPSAMCTASTNIVRKAKFSPPPPPPRRLLLTESDLKNSPSPKPRAPGIPMMKNQQQQTGSRYHQQHPMGSVMRVATTVTTATTTTPPSTKRKDSIPATIQGESKSGNIADNYYSAGVAPTRKTTASPNTTYNISPNASPSTNTLNRKSPSSATENTRKSKPSTDQTDQIWKKTSIFRQSPTISGKSLHHAHHQQQLQRQQPTNQRASPIETPPQSPTTTTSMTTTTSASSTTTTAPSPSPSQMGAAPGSGLSPRLEMRLALNHDILGDEDLISYDPGPDLTTILGHDLSTFHRLTGRDLLTRSANRIQPKEAVISYLQQRNSKMDTPTLNRKRQKQSLGTWSSSVYADRVAESGISAGSFRSSNNSSEESKLSDLELLAKREKIYCKSQLKSGSPARTMRSTISMGTGIDAATNRAKRFSRDETVLLSNKEDTRSSRFFNFLTRRNSENQLTKIFSRDSLDDSTSSSVLDKRLFSPRKDNDKPPLNRRFWKQLTKRRRAHSVSEIAAS